ncbi:MAG: MBL fold metallo-hydrolase [Chloroflexi bacterium]|nr:MBL fold metallo-hydrolase [Chloroflexota bacterium]
MGIGPGQQSVRCIRLSMRLGRLLPFRLSCNVYAIQTRHGVALFDCGSHHTREDLSSALQSERVSTVLLTHGHADHAGGGGHWLRQGTEILAAAEEWPMLRSGGPSGVPGIFRYPGYEPSAAVATGDRISVGSEFRFTVLNTPGHTPGSVCYHEEDRDILICGDLFFGPFWGQASTFALEFLTAQRQSGADLQSQVQAMERLMGDGVIKPTTLILPGHGPAFHMKEKPTAIARSSKLLRLCCRL